MGTYLIIGLGPSGLFVARQLARHEYSIIIGIGKSDDIGQYSNVLKEYYVAEDIEDFNATLEKIIVKYDRVIPLLCSDQYLSMLIKCETTLRDKMIFQNPSYEMLALFADKIKLLNYCREINLKIPVSTTLDEVDSLNLPLIVKPAVKSGISKIGKVVLVRNKDELILLKNRIHTLGENVSDYVSQPFIEGDNSFEYGYGGYFIDGKPTVDICFYQLRQYPQGICCYTLEIENISLIENIKNLVSPFLDATKYSGFLQFDIKQDANTKELFVLDINPRPWGSISMLSLKLLQNGPLWTSNNIDVKVAWRFPLKEILSFKNRENVSYRDINKIQKQTSYSMVVDLLERKDLRPFLIQPIVVLRKLFKGYLWKTK